VIARGGVAEGEAEPVGARAPPAPALRTSPPHLSREARAASASVSLLGATV
jgi:hypothetical protein